MLSDELICGLRADTLDRLEIIASKQKTQINKLRGKYTLTLYTGERKALTWDFVMSRPSSAFFRSTSRIGCFLASEKVRCRYRIGVPNVNVSISSDPAAYTYGTIYKATVQENKHATFPPRASSAH
jgi:hypothetical protein